MAFQINRLNGCLLAALYIDDDEIDAPPLQPISDLGKRRRHHALADQADQCCLRKRLVGMFGVEQGKFADQSGRTNQFRSASGMQT